MQHLAVHSGFLSAAVPAERMSISLTDDVPVEITKEAERYTLRAETMRSSVMQLNGKDLSVSGICEITEIVPEKQEAGIALLAPGSCTFFVM